jgi:hypothetical protein
MYGVKVRIRRILEECPPDTFVECLFTDYDGQTHYFRDKLPVFCTEWEPKIPCDGVIRCRVTEEAEKWVMIDTMLPDDVESTMGEYKFKVSRSDLTDNA